jgi:hypothetical protein
LPIGRLLTGALPCHLFLEKNRMKTTLAPILVAVVLFIACSVHAEYAVWDKGVWPENWPKELEPLRKQARTLEGPKAPDRRYLIPFTKREDFESAWPHLLKVKSKGAPIILLHGPKTDFFAVKPAGVLIKSPPVQAGELANPETPLPRQTDVRTKWMNTIYIELVVDGEIVDLNRIPLPPDTPIVDERFKEEKKK